MISTSQANSEDAVQYLHLGAGESLRAQVPQHQVIVGAVGDQLLSAGLQRLAERARVALLQSAGA